MARLYRKNFRKKKKRLNNQQPPKTNLRTVETQQAAEQLQASAASKYEKQLRAEPDGQTENRKNRGIFAKIMLVINIILCGLLIYLLFFDNRPQQRQSFEKCPTPVKLYNYIEDNYSNFSVVQDSTFIRKALNHDESIEHRLFMLNNELQKECMEIKAPDEKLKEHINFIDTLNLTDEQTYELYEEKQTEEISEPENCGG